MARRSVLGARVAVALLALSMSACANLPGIGSLFGGDPATRRMEKMAEAQREAARAEQPEPAPRTFEQELANADRYRDSGELSGALWHYVSAHALDPNSPTPRLRIAFIQLKNDPLIAEELFRELLQQGNESAGLLGGLALAQRAQGKRLEARRSVESARLLDPMAPVLIMLMGAILDDLGEYEEAQALFSDALATSPSDPGLLNNLGVSFLLAGKWDDAVWAFQRALSVQPDGLALHNNIGIALGRLERYDEAYGHFRKAGSPGAAHNNLGYVYYLNGRYEDAMHAYERALDLEGVDKLTVLRNLEAAQQEQLALEPGFDERISELDDAPGLPSTR
jgi:Flp pilus assembly protein TadD